MSILSRGRNYWSGLRTNAADMLGEQVFAAGPEVILAAVDTMSGGEQLSTSVANKLVALIILINRSDKILYKQDRQETIAELIGLFFTSRRTRQRVARFGEELIEAGVRVQNVFERHPLGDPHHPHGDPSITARNLQIAPDVLKGTYQGVPMAQRNANPNPPTGAQPAAASAAVPAAAAAATAASVARPVPEPSRNVLHLVGTLTESERTTFWGIVAAIQTELNDVQAAEVRRHGRTLQPTEALAGTEVVQLVNRVTLTREQLKAIIGAPTIEQQRDALLSALRQATSAGGPGSGFGRVWDRIMGMVETALPSGGNVGNPLEDLRAKNAQRKREDDDVSGIR